MIPGIIPCGKTVGTESCSLPCASPADAQSKAKAVHKSWLVATFPLRQLLVGHRCLWEGSTQNSTQPEVSPGSQTSTWHPGYQCSPWIPAVYPPFLPEIPADDYVKQLPHPHPGCVGSTCQCPCIYPPTPATWAQGWALPALINSRPII